jgi:hypothetical protein
MRKGEKEESEMRKRKRKLLSNNQIFDIFACLEIIRENYLFLSCCFCFSKKKGEREEMREQDAGKSRMQIYKYIYFFTII